MMLLPIQPLCGDLIGTEQKVLDLLYFFTPLIQLCAAICLLFFYVSTLLEQSPLHSYVKGVDDKFKNIVTILQLYYSFNEENENKEKGIPMNYIIEDWEEFRPRVKNMAALTFFYCVFILFAISIGKYNYFRRDTPYIYLLSTSVFIFIYNICCSFINSKIFKTYVAPSIFAFIIIPILYFSCFKWLESQIFKIEFLKDPQLTIAVIVCSTSLLGLFLVLCYNGKVFWRIKKPKTRKLIKLSDSLKLLYDVLFLDNINEIKQTIIKQRNIYNESLIEIIKNLDDESEIKTQIKNFIRDEVPGIFVRIMNEPSLIKKLGGFIKTKKHNLNIKIDRVFKTPLIIHICLFGKKQD